MRAMKKQRAIRHTEFGAPNEVLCLETIDLPVPGRGEVLVQLEAAAINPSDYGMIGGSYGKLRQLPATAGREGVGKVVELGEGVTQLKEGDRVRFPGEEGAWQEFACGRAEDLLLVPEGLDLEQVACSFINPPTAYCLLHEIVPLKPGDWIVQNAGNSAVGVSVIQMAKVMGVKTISQVRREELIEPLKKLGADEVVIEGSGWGKRIQELTGGSTMRLALNSIGGPSATDQIKVLDNGGTQITLGGMVGDPVRFPTRFLIFNDVRLVGFWWDEWSRREGMVGVQRIMDCIYGLMNSGDLQLPIEATYGFEDFAEAIARDKQPRMGKVLLKP